MFTLDLDCSNAERSLFELPWIPFSNACFVAESSNPNSKKQAHSNANTDIEMYVSIPIQQQEEARATVPDCHFLNRA